MGGLVVSCQHVRIPQPSATTQDSTPPLLKLGSAGLRKDISLTQDSTISEKRRAKRSDEILLLASAEDAETGIKQVSLHIELRISCGQTTTHQTFTETNRAHPNGTLPVKLAKPYTINFGPMRAGCGHTTSRIEYSIVAETENGVGQIRRLQPASISSFGPDTVRVATFNIFGGKAGGHPDSVYQRWGQFLGSKADVLLLNEVIDHRIALLLANAAGMPFVHKMSDGDVAIIAREQLYNIQEHKVAAPGNNNLGSNYSSILSAVINIAGYPHQFYSTHWAIRSNDTLYPAHWSSTARLLAAKKIIDTALPLPEIVIIGGDLNAFSGYGPQDHDENQGTPDWVGPTAEVELLRNRFRDPFVEINMTNNDYCSNKRIDYILVDGPYVPVRYEACFAEASPSDHPLVIVTFEAGDF